MILWFFYNYLFIFCIFWEEISLIVKTYVFVWDSLSELKLSLQSCYALLAKIIWWYDMIFHVNCRRDHFTFKLIPPIQHIEHHLGFLVLWLPQWLGEELIFQHNHYLQMSLLFLLTGSMLTSRSLISRFLLGLVPTVFLAFLWNVEMTWIYVYIKIHPC